MSDTLTSPLVTAMTRREGWEIVQWTPGIVAASGYGLGGLATGTPLHAEVGQPDTAILFLDEGQPLQAHDRDIAQMLGLGDAVRDATQRFFFVRAERGEQSTFHVVLLLSCRSV